jgi:acid phosphatase (class A)
MGKTLYFFLILIAVGHSLTAKSREPNYLAPSQVSLYELLSPPPAPDSEAQKRDVQSVLQAQETRTDEQIKMAQADVKVSVFRFADVMGPNFKPENLPVTAKLFNQVTSDEGQIVETAKERFNRPRPFVVRQDIHPVINQPANASYPSGHAAFAYVAAIILAQMAPEKSAALFERAAIYSQNRIIAGVHFPTDIETGRISGSVIAYALLHEPRFLDDLVPAKAELRKALGMR